MAKTRAQRKAERRARQQRAEQQDGGNGAGAEAQHRTQVPESGEVAEVEAVLQTGAQPEELGEHVHGGTEIAEPEAPEVEAEVADPPEAPAPSRADVGAPQQEDREQRKARREREKEQRRKQRTKQLQKDRKAPTEPKQERRRGAILSFLISCWAELKRVQWPDRETLVQASAVTVIFISVAAAYLGALDALFSWLVKLVL